ncbi:response regulator [Pendulispora rubella]|uniref:Response regulator n=1 Tax=Pendulispora rubella TaxID=2741070 RepID=A0ABZ2LJ84_9BACT
MPDVPESMPAPRPLVLYVDDDAGNLAAARLLLEDHYELLEAENDEQACTCLKREGERLDMILMDIQLKRSHLDGVGLVKLIRGTLDRAGLPGYTLDVPVLATPVIFLTAYGRLYPSDELFRAGGADIVIKPVDFIKLSNAMARYLTHRALSRLG